MTSSARMRIDLWLWRARFFKTRSMAAASISEHGARIERDGHTRRVEKPSAEIAQGDMLAFSVEGGARLVRVLHLPDRRGPGAEAAACYDLLGAAGGRPGPAASSTATDASSQAAPPNLSGVSGDPNRQPEDPI